MSDTGKPTYSELEAEVGTKRAQIELYDKTVTLLRSELDEAKGQLSSHQAEARELRLTHVEMRQLRAAMVDLRKIIAATKADSRQRAVKLTPEPAPKPVEQAPSKTSKIMRWLNG